MTVGKKLYTRAAFEALLKLPAYANRHLELIDGEIIEVSPTLDHGLISALYAGELYVFLKANPIGKVMVELDHYLPDDDENTRRPDVSYISSERLAELARDEWAPIMPDLAIEVKSPSQSYSLID